MANPMELLASRCNYVFKRDYFVNCDDNFHIVDYIDSGAHNDDNDHANGDHNVNPRNHHD